MSIAADYFRMTFRQKRKLRLDLIKEAKASRPDLTLQAIRSIVDRTMAQLMTTRGADA